MNSEKFSRAFEKKVLDTIKKFNLFNKKHKILVAVSGGKDSTVLLKILHKNNFDIEAVTVDAHIGCYTQENLERIRKLCNEINIKLHEISFRKEFGSSLCYLRDRLNKKGFNLKSCAVCGVLRRYLINKKARQLKPDRIATGHNLDDEAQAFLMNVFKNNLYLSARGGPITEKNNHFVQRVKPLFLTSTKDIVNYVKANNIDVKIGKCPCSTDSFRNSFKDMLNDLEKKNPKIKYNIVNFFLRNLDDLKSEFKKGSKSLCNSCGEPSSKNYCRTCQILSKL